MDASALTIRLPIRILFGMKHTFFIWTAALLLLGATIRPVHGQLLYPEVTVDLQRLPEEAQAKLQGLDSILTRYIEEAR